MYEYILAITLITHSELQWSIDTELDHQRLTVFQGYTLDMTDCKVCNVQSGWETIKSKTVKICTNN